MTIKVYVVDDSAIVRQTLQFLVKDDPDIELLGSAPNPLIAAPIIRKNRPDVLLLDIEMPGMDGFDLTRHIRAMPHLGQLPVVVVSTRDRAEDRLRGLEAGADAYITKQGLDATELAATVRRLAGRP